MRRLAPFLLLAILVALTGCSRWVGYGVGDADDGPNSAAVANLIPDGSNFAFLGDVYESGTASDFANNFNDVWGRLHATTYPTPGNHDWPNHSTGYDPYWGSRAPQAAGQHAYWVQEEGWTVLSLNSEESLASGSTQLTYAKYILESRAGTCAVVFTHEPRFGVAHVDRTDLQPLWDAMQGHAVLYVSGHDHLMAESNVVQGVTELVSGAGGRSLYGLSADPHPNIAWYQNSQHGVLKATFDVGRVDWQFINTAGQVLRSGSRTCTPRQ